jgi:hypothetical protein
MRSRIVLFLALAVAVAWVDLWLDREAFPEACCADVDPETAKVMAAT